MPTYDYQCRSCGFITEVIHSMFEDGPTECERCGGQLRRVFHPTGIIFKGGGFYKTDSRSTATGASSTASTDATTPATSSMDKGSSDKGPAAKSSGDGAGKGNGGSA